MFEETIKCDICGKTMQENYNTDPPTIRYFELKYKVRSPFALPFNRESTKFDICSKCMSKILEYVRSDSNGDSN